MKIGRNDRCPCGSGRKLKHCCLVAPNSGSIRNFVPASPAASSAFSASLGVQWALDDLRTLTLWFGAQPVEALDESKRGALGILAGDLLGAIERGGPIRPLPIDMLGHQRLFFGGSVVPLWLALAPVVSSALFAPNRAATALAPFSYAEGSHLTLAVGRIVPWVTASGKPMTPNEVARILQSLPHFPGMAGILSRLSTCRGSLLSESLLRDPHCLLCGMQCIDESTFEPTFVPCHVALAGLSEQVGKEEGVAREEIVVLWTGSQGLRFAIGLDCGRTVAPRTQEWIKLLSRASGRAPTEVVRTLVLDPVFAPLLPLHDFDHGKSFSRLDHFVQWCANASDRLWDQSVSRHQGNVAREMVAYAKKSSPLFDSLARIVQENSATGERMREVFGELWKRGELRGPSLSMTVGSDASLPSFKAMLSALDAPRIPRAATHRKASPKDSHAHRRLGLWRARRSGIEALGLDDATLMNACAKLEQSMRQDLAKRGLPVRLAPAVVIERAPGTPEATYLSGVHTLAVHPKLFERPWRHVADTGLWALAHVLEEVYAGRRPRTGLAPAEIEGMLGGDRSSWELACHRLSLRAELRGARETLFEVPEEGWLSSDGLDAEERRFLEKVDKLLALSNSSNEHEAALAMERAQALLETRGAERHRDRMGANGSGSRRADGSGPHGSTPFVRLTLSLGVNQIGAIHKSLAGLLAAHYQVRAVWGREYDVAESTEAVSLTLLGRREHVLLAEHVFDFLDHQVDVLWQRARRERDLAGSGRLSFQLGLLAGFRGKLAAARSARTTADVARGSDTTALLRLERDDLEAFVSQVYPNLTSLGRGSVSLKADVFEAGKDEGGRLSVHTPVASREDPGAGVRRALTS